MRVDALEDVGTAEMDISGIAYLYDAWPHLCDVVLPILAARQLSPYRAINPQVLLSILVLPQTTMALKSKKQNPTEEVAPSSTSRRPPAPVAPPYAETTDRSLVNRPVNRLVHADMSQVWKIFEHSQMCILFDAFSPLRQFKRGTVFNKDDDPYAEHDPRSTEDVTESDDEEAPLQPYKPAYY